MQNKGSRYQPGTRSFKFSDCVSLVLFLCVIQFGRETGGGGGGADVTNAPFISIWPMIFVILHISSKVMEK